ncbi:MAG: tetratricopeptide repeat protein, partial [Erythrobacter sp.]
MAAPLAAQTADTPQDQPDLAPADAPVVPVDFSGEIDERLSCPDGISSDHGQPTMTLPELRELAAEADKAVNSGELDRAIEIAAEILPESRARYGLSDQYSSHLVTYANLLFQAQRNRVAVQATCEAAYIAEQNVGLAHPTTQQLRWMHGQSLAALGELNRAEVLYREALTALEIRLASANPSLIDAKLRFAALRLQQGFENEALQIVREQKELIPENAPWSHQMLLFALNVETGALQKSTDPKITEQFYTEEVSARLERPEDNIGIVNFLLASQSVWLSERGLDQKALDAHERQIEFLGEFYQQNHPAILAARAWGVMIYKQLGRSDEAIAIARSTLEGWERNGSPPEQSYPARQALADLLLERREYEPAIELVEENLKIRRNRFGEETLATAEAKMKLADAHSASGRHARAIEIMEETIPVYERFLSFRNAATINAKLRLASAYEEVSRLSEAKELAEATFENALEHLGHNNIYTPFAASVARTVYMREGNRAKMFAMSQRILALFEEDGDEANPYYIQTLNHYASDLLGVGDQEKALEVSEKALSLARENFSEKNRVLFSVLSDRTNLLIQMGDAVAAEPIAAENYQLSRDTFGSTHYSTRFALMSYAQAIAATGNLPQALVIINDHITEIAEDKGTSDRDYLFAVLLRGNFEVQAGYLPEAAYSFSFVEEGLSNRDDLLDQVFRYGALTGLAITLAQDGKPQEALDAARKARPLARRLVAVGLLEEWMDNVPKALEGLVLGEQERWIEADRVLSDVAFDASVNKSFDIGIKSALTLARLHQEGREAAAWESAQVLARLRRESADAIGLDPRVLNERSWEKDLRAASTTVIADAAYSAQNAEIADNTFPLGFEALQQSSLDQATLAIAKTASVRAAQSANLGELVQERLGLIDAWSAVDTQLTNSLSGFGQNQVDAGELRASRSGIEARLQEIEAQLKEQFPTYYGFIRPQPLSISAAQSLFASNEAGLLWVPSEFGTHVVVVSSDGVRWHRSDMTADEMAEAVDALRAGL